MQKPFKKWDGYLVYHKQMQRWQVCLKHLETSERRTLLYSKFLMSIKHGRWLYPDEEVDHIDGDKSNDTLENLEILTSEKHREKTNIENGHIKESAICPACKKEFIKKRKSRRFCCRSCADSLRNCMGLNQYS